MHARGLHLRRDQQLVAAQHALLELEPHAADAHDFGRHREAEIPNVVIELEKQMRDAAESLDFERAIALVNR